MLNNIADTEQDFDNLATMFNDTTWSYNNMRNYFKLIEKNLSLNSSDPDHGFNGWLKTSVTPNSLTATALTGQSTQLDRVFFDIYVVWFRSPVPRHSQHHISVRSTFE